MEDKKRLKRNWKAKYLTIEAFNAFKNNDFRHLKWEVHGIGIGVLILLGLVTTIFALALAKLFGG